MLKNVEIDVVKVDNAQTSLETKTPPKEEVKEEKPTLKSDSKYLAAYFRKEILRDKGMLEAGEMIYSIHKALNDYRFAWTDENKTVLIRGNK